MKPNYRPPVRIVRGAAHMLAPGTCPVCGNRASVTSKGVRRKHYDLHGLCAGSGMIVDRTVAPLDIDKVLAAVPPTQRIQLDVLDRHASATDRKQVAPRCPECGQNPRERGDGTLEAHRIQPFVGPYCPGGQPKGRT